MDYDKLNKEQQEFIDGLKHGAYTIECDVKNNFESADTIEDFKANTISAMNDLIGEAMGVIKDLEGWEE